MRRSRGRRLTLRDGTFRGIIVPAGEVNIAIVGQPGEALDGIERRLRLALRFASHEGPDEPRGGIRRERNA